MLAARLRAVLAAGEPFRRHPRFASEQRASTLCETNFRNGRRPSASLERRVALAPARRCASALAGGDQTWSSPAGEGFDVPERAHREGTFLAS
jgi:hypothetical protein